MSRPRIAAIVCEGQTDLPILRAALEAVWPELEDVRCLQPELDEMDRAKGPAGWTQVKAWCDTHAGALEDVLTPDVGDPIDLLVIAIDVDIAIEAGMTDPPRRGVGRYETTRLQDTIRGWLRKSGRSNLPPAIVVSTPVMAIEAWVLAALFPREKAPESVRDPARRLVEKKKLRNSPADGKPWKELHLYRDFAPRVAANLKRVRSRCHEADRALRVVEQRRDQLEASR